MHRLPARAQVGEDGGAAHQGAARVLGDDRLHRAVDQQRPCLRREAVADEDDLALPPRLLQRAGHALRPAADGVDAGKVGVVAEQRPRLPVALGLVVMGLAQAHHLDDRGHLLQDVEESQLAVLVRAVAEAAGDHRDLARPPAEEAREQIARRPPRRPVVEPDIGGPPAVLHIGNQRHRRHVARRQLVHRLAHRRMLQRHEGHPVDLAPVLEQAARQQVGVEALDELHLRADAQRGQRRLRLSDELAEPRQVAVRPVRQQEGQPHRLRSQRRAEIRFRDVIQLRRGLHHALHGRRAHAGAVVQHTVHGGRRDSGQPRDVGDPRQSAGVFGGRGDGVRIILHHGSKPSDPIKSHHHSRLTQAIRAHTVQPTITVEHQTTSTFPGRKA
ncbi:protein of unknown function (plasmid) [Azospirillum baldaniorum]|uniref:Uncharacterized protein n=1 Tax=Azospirillum baldaniorum TaxID=1064539 RepID=A0A9P1NQ45_9PROT|nr:protein of unknown function [Azospirillum baldaniorum]